MAAPLRQQILDAVVTRLNTITTSNGYNLQIGAKVYDWRMNPIAPAGLPAIEVRDKAVTTELTTLDGAASHRLALEIVVLAAGKTAPAVVRQGLQDIHTALHTDRTFGGLVDSFTPDGTDIDVQSDEDLLAAGQYSCSMTYYTAAGVI